MKYLILIILLSGCSSAKELMDKAEKKDPAIVAKYARDKYPCTDLLKPDTAVIYQDSLIYIDCPETPVNTYEVVKYDTVNNVITKIVRVPVNMPVQVKTITKWYEDSAKLKILTEALNKANTDNLKLAEANDKLSKKVANKSKENWFWRVVAIIFIGITVFRFWNKLTTIKVKSI